MKRTTSVLVSLATLAACSAANAEEGRFDAQIFRPAAGPRDLVMVQKSEVIGHKSPVVGLYSDIALDPLTLLAINTGKNIDAVGARLQVTGLAGIGLFDWAEVTMAMPFVAWQTSDNLRSLGSEGEVASQALGDLRLSTKIAIPYLNRKALIKEGFGMAVAGNVNLPTGNQNAFASDGVVTGGATLIADYRFNFGLLISANGGVWLRPDRQFAGTKVGDMASWGTAAEMYVVQRWGWSVLGGVYGHVSLSKFPDSPSQVPAEALLGMRWQWSSGFTLTVGGNFGANCGFGAPLFRAWAGLTWQPSKSREQQDIDRLKQIDSEDPDHDGLIGQADRCPSLPGLPENVGCPDTDSDKDGIVDREDKCPVIAGVPRGGGCPGAYVAKDEIQILDQVHFATDKDIILDDSKPTLDMVVAVLRNNPEIRHVEIEGHTDIRASDAYNMDLSQRRVDSVRTYMIEKGIEPGRLSAKGYGHTKPAIDDTGCTGKDEELSATCKYATEKNRRVVFRIKRTGASSGKAVGGGDTVLSPNGGLSNEGTLGNDGVLHGGGALPTGGILPSSGVLEERKSTLPSSSLPKQGETNKPEEPKAPETKDGAAEPPKDEPKATEPKSTSTTKTTTKTTTTTKPLTTSKPGTSSKGQSPPKP